MASVDTSLLDAFKEEHIEGIYGNTVEKKDLKTRADLTEVSE